MWVYAREGTRCCNAENKARRVVGTVQWVGSGIVRTVSESHLHPLRIPTVDKVVRNMGGRKSDWDSRYLCCSPEYGASCLGYCRVIRGRRRALIWRKMHMFELPSNLYETSGADPAMKAYASIILRIRILLCHFEGHFHPANKRGDNSILCIGGRRGIVR